MIIYNKYTVNFNSIDQDYIVRWQSDLENTKESILPVCYKFYHNIKENLPHLEELENVCITLKEYLFSFRTINNNFVTPLYGVWNVAKFNKYVYVL